MTNHPNRSKPEPVRSANPICAAMGWQAPGAREVLMIELNGRLIARLTPRRPESYTYEGLYLCNADGSAYGSCFSVVGDRTADQIKGALAQKLNIKRVKLEQLTAEIVAPHKL